MPEAPNSERNWDYRYCWLRDAYFVINALNRLGATRFAGALPALHREHHRRRRPGSLQPVYGLERRKPRWTERLATHLAGYRRHGAGAGRQPGLGTGTARCVRRGDPWRLACILRSPPRHARRPRVAAEARAARGAGVCEAHAAGRRHLGIPRPPRGAHLFRRDVLGRLRPPGQDRRSGGPRSRRLLARAGRRDPRAGVRACLERRTRRIRGHVRRALRSMQACSCSARSDSCAGTTRASLHGRRDRTSPAPRRLPAALRQAR